MRLISDEMSVYPSLKLHRVQVSGDLKEAYILIVYSDTTRLSCKRKFISGRALMVSSLEIRV